MIQCRRLGAVVLFFGGPLMLCAPAHAGPILDRCLGRDTKCPPTEYSAWHYWTPGLYRVYDACRLPPPGRYLYSADPVPAVPANCIINAYSCPGVPPAALSYGPNPIALEWSVAHPASRDSIQRSEYESKSSSNISGINKAGPD
jgi:hypothetical protein